VIRLDAPPAECDEICRRLMTINDLRQRREDTPASERSKVSDVKQTYAPMPTHVPDPVLRRDRLDGTRVAIAVASDYRAAYLGNAIVSSGGRVAGVAADVAELETLLDRHAPAALIVNHELPGRGLSTALDAAIDRGVRVVVVGPARLDSGSPLHRHACMLDPCAGFQVVEAVAEALDEGTDDAASSARAFWPVRNGNRATV
jgi:hypothetical protein